MSNCIGKIEFNDIQTGSDKIEFNDIQTGSEKGCQIASVRLSLMTYKREVTRLSLMTYKREVKRG